MVNIPNDHFGPIPPEADPRGTVSPAPFPSPAACHAVRYTWHCWPAALGAQPDTAAGLLAQASGVKHTPDSRTRSSSSSLSAAPQQPCAACSRACRCARAGHQGGRVLEGSAGLPPVGRTLPARGGYRGPVQRRRTVRGAVWRVSEGPWPPQPTLLSCRCFCGGVLGSLCCVGDQGERDREGLGWPR